jgi:hypothetical protein
MLTYAQSTKSGRNRDARKTDLMRVLCDITNLGQGNEVLGNFA